MFSREIIKIAYKKYIYIYIKKFDYLNKRFSKWVKLLKVPNSNNNNIYIGLTYSQRNNQNRSKEIFI